MSKVRLSLLATAAVFLAATGFAAASGLMLHVTTGEWQITNSMTMSGMENMMGGMDSAQLASMPPATRARIQAQMAAMNGAHVNNVTSCVTQKDLDHPFHPEMGHDVTCKYDVQKSSFTDEVVHVSCTGKHTMDGTFQFSAPTPVTMRGHMDMTMSEGGRTMHMLDDISGHWVSAQCKAGDNSVE